MFKKEHSGNPGGRPKVVGRSAIWRGLIAPPQSRRWRRSFTAETLRTLQYALEGLLGINSATDNQPLMDDIAALVTLASAAERVGEAGGSALDVFAAYSENVLRSARDPKPLSGAAD